jgi:hypothetical protein
MPNTDRPGDKVVAKRGKPRKRVKRGKPVKRVKRGKPVKRVLEHAWPPVLEHARSALQSRTPEDIANEQSAEQLALRIWAAMVGEMVLSGMSALMDELLQSHLLDDDDEEGDDEGWLDNHQKREKKLLDETIMDGSTSILTLMRSIISR